MPKLPTGMCKFLLHLCYIRIHTQSRLISATPSRTCKHNSQAAVTSNARSTHKLISDRHCQAWHAKVQPYSLCPSVSHRPDTTRLCSEATSEMSVQMVSWPPTVSWLWETAWIRSVKERKRRRMSELSDPETWVRQERLSCHSKAG